MKVCSHVSACQNSTVSPRRVATAGVIALAAVSLGCPKAAVDCTPPPYPLPAPEAGCPSFTNDVLPIFQSVCDNCHAPGQVEANRPLTTYQQINAQVGAVFTQVFENCLMPPSNAPEPLTASERQTLLDWFACGALDDAPATDAAVGN